MIFYIYIFPMTRHLTLCAIQLYTVESCQHRVWQTTYLLQRCCKQRKVNIADLENNCFMVSFAVLRGQDLLPKFLSCPKEDINNATMFLLSSLLLKWAVNSNRSPRNIYISVLFYYLLTNVYFCYYLSPHYNKFSLSNACAANISRNASKY